MKRRNYKTLKRLLIIMAIMLSICLFIGFTFLLLYLKVGNDFLIVFENPSREQAWLLTTNLLTSFSFSSMFFLIVMRIIKFIRLFKTK